MRKITVEGIEINFNDLTEQKQKEIYEKNKKKYKQEASKSKYYSIRLAVVENETDSSELLNIMMRAEIEGYMDNRFLVGSIFKNKIFEIEEETIKILVTSSDWKYRQKAAELSKDSKLLNQMLRNEVNGEQDDNVEEAIFTNEAFEIEEETIKILVTSSDWKYRQKAAELSKDSKLLNQMLRNEVNGGQDDDVEEAIFTNEAFEIEEETIKILATSDVGVYRKKAAKLSKDSKLLNQMLRKEVNDEQNDDVEEAIFANEAFEIEEETIKILETSDFYGYRQKAAELSKDVGRLLRMLAGELNNGTFEVVKAIVENDLFEKEAVLEYIQNNY